MCLNWRQMEFSLKTNKVVNSIFDSSSRNPLIDLLKGIAILSVVFYHLGIMPYGYLGVDIFLVINGFLITKGILSAQSKGGLNYGAFLLKRLVRLWPLVVMAGLVSLVIGYFVMLPDDLENLGQSVVASNFFLNNVLACITTGNYWDLVNTYKPLMHFWYLGVVVQCYLVYPLIFLAAKVCFKGNNYESVSRGILWLLLASSLIFYLFPFFSTAHKFYYLPFRFFEIAFGGILAVEMKRNSYNPIKWMLGCICIVGLSVLLMTESLGNEIKILVINLFACGCLAVCFVAPIFDKRRTFVRLLEIVGRSSFSIFVWHQVVFAFYKYTVSNSFLFTDYLIVLAIVVFVSMISYCRIETPLAEYAKVHLVRIMVITSCIAVITTLGGLYLYLHAGVVRDVPELDMFTTNIHRGMHAEYCDRVYKMETDFAYNGKKKVMVVGDSYARDFVNVLLESSYRDSLDIRYMFPHQLQLTEIEVRRLQEADIVFVRASYIHNNPRLFSQLRSLCVGKLLYGISTKEYGETNGDIYQRRFRKDYFESRTEMSANYWKAYLKEKDYWGDSLVDFVSTVSDEYGRLPVFTNDKKYISQDCRHLTQSGAKYYARILNLAFYLDLN